MSAAGLRLYEISGELAAIADELVESGGELSPELLAALEQLEGAFETKIEGILLHVRNLDAQATAAKEEAARLAGLAGSRDRAAQGLRRYVLECMVAADRLTVETARVRARIQANARPTIQWVGPLELIPDPFKRVTITVDGAKLYETWKTGEPLPEGFVIERGRHLRIS